VCVCVCVCVKSTGERGSEAQGSWDIGTRPLALEPTGRERRCSGREFTVQYLYVCVCARARVCVYVRVCVTSRGVKPVCVLVYRCVRGRSLYTYEKGVLPGGGTPEREAGEKKMAH